MCVYNFKSMQLCICVRVYEPVCVVEYVLVCAFVYMQRVQVSLFRRIGDHCASISMPLSSGQGGYEMALTLGLSLINAHKHLMS